MPKIRLDAERRIAFDSPDHDSPVGTAQDNSRNPVFSEKLHALWPDKTLRVLDVGCSGGGFVRSCLDAGDLAVGLEGSDFSQRHGRAEWSVIPESLFTCDVTHPFDLTLDDEPLQFDVVTAWEFMEHLSKDQLPGFCENLRRHLSLSGLAILSVSTKSCHLDGRHYHQTVESPSWWREMFQAEGFDVCSDLVRWFEPDWVRGPLQNAPGCFHLVLSHRGGARPEPPPVCFEASEGALLETGRLFVDVGRQFEDKGSFLYAWMQLDRALDASGELPDAWWLRGEALEGLGCWEAARHSASMELAQRSEHAGARDLMARVDDAIGPHVAQQGQRERLLSRMCGESPLGILVQVADATELTARGVSSSAMVSALTEAGHVVIPFELSEDRRASPSESIREGLDAAAGTIHLVILSEACRPEDVEAAKALLPNALVARLSDDVAGIRGAARAEAVPGAASESQPQAVSQNAEPDVILCRSAVLTDSRRQEGAGGALLHLPASCGKTADYRAGFRGRDGLAFLPRGDRAQDEDARAWIDGELLPALRERFPEVVLHEVGAVSTEGGEPEPLGMLQRRLALIAPSSDEVHRDSEWAAARHHGLPILCGRDVPSVLADLTSLISSESAWDARLVVQGTADQGDEDAAFEGLAALRQFVHHRLEARPEATPVASGDDASPSSKPAQAFVGASSVDGWTLASTSQANQGLALIIGLCRAPSKPDSWLELSEWFSALDAGQLSALARERSAACDSLLSSASPAHPSEDAECQLLRDDSAEFTTPTQLGQTACRLLRDLTVNPGNVAAWVMTSVLLTQLGEYGLSREVLARARLLHPGSRLVTGLRAQLRRRRAELVREGEKAITSDRLNDAAVIFLRLLLHEPPGPDIWNDIGVLLNGFGHADAALVAFGNALSIDAGFLAARNNRDAVAAGGASAGPLSRLLTQAARELERGELGAALPAIVAHVVRAPDACAGWCAGGVVLHACGFLPESLAAFGRALESECDHGPSLANRAAILGEEAAGDTSLLALATAEEQLDAEESRGLAVLASGKTVEGIRSLMALVGKDASRAEAWAAVAGALADLGMTEKSLSAFDSALSAEPRHRAALLGRAQASWSVGRRSTAIDDLELVLEAAPGDIEASSLLERVRSSYLPA